MQITHTGLEAREKRCEIVRDSSVDEFIKRGGYASTFMLAEENLLKIFNHPEKLTIELFASPEDGGVGGDRIVFTIKSEMDRQTFRRAIAEFIELMQKADSRLIPLISLSRDL